MTFDHDKMAERVNRHAHLAAKLRRDLCAGGLGYEPQTPREQILCSAIETLSTETDATPRAVREAILLEAARLTMGDRNETHGEPLPNMELVAYFALPVLSADIPDGVRGAVLGLIQKLARGLYNPYHRDTWIDLAAYSAIAGECAEAVRPRE